MITILSCCIYYLAGMMLYAIVTGRLLYWGGWKSRTQNKGMYYSGLCSYTFVLFILYTIKGLEESRLVAV